MGVKAEADTYGAGLLELLEGRSHGCDGIGVSG